MPENFGARLRRHRERQAIALVTIADQTKIKLSLLEGLERDDVSHWPSGIFRRAFVRAYAQAIGLNSDVVVREFLEAYPEPAEVAAAALAAAADAAHNGGAPPTRLRCLLGSAIGSLSGRRRLIGVADLPAANGTPLDIPAPTAPPAVAESIPTKALPAREPDLLAVANLCTRFGRVESATELQTLLREAAGILGATGLIVWIWDGLAGELRPALAHGYSDRVLSLLPPVRRDADNVTAAAFRSGESRAIAGSDRVNGALVVPLFTPAGCAGVLAFELPCSSEPALPVRAVATIFAALLAQLIGAPAEEAAPQINQIDMMFPAAAGFAAVSQRHH